MSSLKSRLTLAMLISFLAGIWSLSFYASWTLQRDMERQLGEHELATISLMVSDLEEDLQDGITSLEGLASAIDAAMLDHPVALQRLLNQWPRGHFNAGILAYRADGTAIAEAPFSPVRIGVNYMDRDYIIGAIEEGKPTIGRTVIGKTHRKPIVVMAAPVRDAEGKVIGAVSGVTDLGRPSFLDKISENHYGKSGGYVLIERSNRLIITATDKSRIMEKLPERGFNPILDRFLDGHEGSFAYTNTRGVEVLNSARTIPGSDWLIGVTLPIEEAFAPIRDMRRRMLLATLFLTLLFGAVIWWALGRQLAPILTSARSLAAMSDAGQPLAPLAIARQDEVGQLVSGFNRLLAALDNRNAELQQMEWKFQALFEKGPIGVAYHEMIYDALGKPVDYRYLDANAAFKDLTGVDPRGKTVLQAFPGIESDPFDWIGTLGHVARTGEDTRFEQFLPLNGRWYDLVAYQYKQDCFVAAFIDITQRKHAEAKLQEASQKLWLHFEQSPLATIEWSLDFRVVRWNPAAEQIFGYSADEAVGQLATFIIPETFLPITTVVWKELVEGTGGEASVNSNVRKDGKLIECTWYNTSLRDTSGRVIGVMSLVQDITERNEAEEKIKALAFFDQITGLPNRSLLMDRLKQSVRASSRSGQYVALLLIDLDNFKMLNDTLGHDMGDMLLRHVAERLLASVRAGDTVARLGGDEFVLILSNLSSTLSDAATLAELVGEKIIATLDQVYQLDGVTYQCTASMGATLFIGERTDIDSLVKQADIAMYRSKKEGGNTLRFFDPDMEAFIVKRAAMEKDLRQAVPEGQLALHYQPQESRGQLMGAEALLRWDHPANGPVSPAEFIPLAEETGLILTLGKWVLEAACDQLAAWAARPETSHLALAVNVSAHQFRQDEFVDDVLRALRKAKANPQRLKLELTESALVANIEDIIEKMFALKAKGVGFSLDDFGTGYSSLSYLKRLPLDQLKIDRSFVHDILIDANDAAIAQTIIALADSFGLTVIAEGVETAAQRDYLSSIGCHSCQGYLISRPLPAEGFARFARQAWAALQKESSAG